jgi:NADH-quinone oxidoreductase subunit N
MVIIFSEIFLALSLLYILVSGSILGFSPKYNYCNISYKNFTCLIVVWAIVLLPVENFANVTIYFVVDYLSQFTKFFLCLGLLLCLNIDTSLKQKSFEYYVLVLLALLGLFIICSSTDFLSLYLALELTTFSFYILAISQRNSFFSVEASLKYFILGALSSALLIFGISFVYGLTGTTNLNYFKILNLIYTPEKLFIIIQLSFLCVSCGLLFKLGSVPFHVWVPDVYEGAPTVVTIMFSVLPKLAIFTFFIRIVFITKLYIWLYWCLFIGFLSIFVGSFGALSQIKFKRLLAFSGISHVGYALIGLSCETLEGYCGCLLYILVYILTAGFLWGLALCVDNSSGRTLYLTDYAQLLQSNFSLGIIAILVIFSLAGIPPFAGFFAKVSIFLACTEISLYSTVVIGLLSSAIGVLYYLRLIKVISIENTEWKTCKKLKKSHVVSLGICGFSLVFFVFYGEFVNLIVQLIILHLTS